MTDLDHIITFAYGSNMLSARLRERAPSAKPCGIGYVKGHSLRWHKRSNDNSGKCDIEYTGCETDMVWGVLFRFVAWEKTALDHAEGLNVGYAEKTVEVISGHALVKAQAYYAIIKDPELRPYDWYRAFVVAGAKEHALHSEYIAGLEAVVSIPDPDNARAAVNEKLLYNRSDLDHDSRNELT